MPERGRGMRSNIAWTKETWNPITGCTKISPGCKNCYAERMARRLAGRHGYPDAPYHFDVTYHRTRLGKPYRWRKPRRVFVCSMGDLFHQDVNSGFIREAWNVMESTRRHTFQVLTKRPDAMKKWLSNDRFYVRGWMDALPNVQIGKA